LAGTAGAPVFVVNSSPLFTFAGVPTTTGDVNILLTAMTPLAAVVAAPAAAGLGATAPVGSDLATVQNAVFALPHAAALNSAIGQLAPGAANLAHG
jgi:hypothetical protein